MTPFAPENALHYPSLVGIGLLAAAVFGGIWLQRRGDQGAGYWASAHGMGSAGVAALTLPPQWAPTADLVATALLFVAGGLLLKGLRRHAGQTFPGRSVWPFLALLIAAHTHFTLVDPDPVIRLGLAGTAGLILLGGSAGTLLGTGIRERSGAYVFTGLAFLTALAAVFLLGNQNLATSPGAPAIEIITDPVTTTIPAALLLPAFSGSIFGLLWLTTLDWRQDFLREQTARWHSETRLGESEKRFRVLFQHCGSAIAFTDAEGRILRVNDAFAGLTGYERAGLEGLDYKTLLHSGDRDEGAADLNRLLRKGRDPFRAERRLITQDGQTVWTDTTLATIRDHANTPQHLAIIARDITVEKKAEEDLAEEASHDGVTGTLTRQYLEQLLAAELDRVSRYGRTTAVVMIDIDHFRHINKRLGRAVGDTLLASLGERAGERLRATDSLGQWDGGRFLALLPETELSGATRLAEDLRAMVAGHTFPNIKQLTISLGVAEIQPGEDTASLLGRVGDALDAAKRRGRNCAEVARPAPGGRWI